MSTAAEVRHIVKEKYGQPALRVTAGGSSCCGAAAACGTDVDPITSNLYDEAEKSACLRKQFSRLLAVEIPRRWQR